MSTQPQVDQAFLDRRLLDYYGSSFDEGERLVSRSDQGLLELERTRALVVDRVVPGSRVIDVGGGTGVHAAWLARRGDVVTLVDPVPAHVERAAGLPGVTAVVGDARRLSDVDRAHDAALLLGPLYHLAHRSDRLQALREAARVVRPGGWVFAAAVSRVAATTFATGVGPAVRRSDEGHETVRTPLPDPWRRLLEGGEGAFGDSGFPGGHFHLAEELEEELVEAGLTQVEVHGLEGPAGMALEVSRSHDPALLAAARTLAEAFGHQPGLRDLSQHLLGLGRTPGGS